MSAINLYSKLYQDGSAVYLRRMFLIISTVFTLISYVILTTITVWNIVLVFGFMVSAILFSNFFSRSLDTYDHIENMFVGIGAGMFVGFMLTLFTHDIYTQDGTIVYNQETQEILKPAINKNFGPRFYIVSEDQPYIKDVTGFVYMNVSGNFEEKIRFNYKFNDEFVFKNKNISFKNLVETQTKLFLSQSRNGRNTHELASFICDSLKKEGADITHCPVSIST
jgi:hypothetical protein